MAKNNANRSDPVLVRQPKDPNKCFVLFPAVHPKASNVAVSLQSLLQQVQQEPGERQVEAIRYDPALRRLEVCFMPESQA